MVKWKWYLAIAHMLFYIGIVLAFPGICIIELARWFETKGRRAKPIKKCHNPNFVRAERIE